MPKQLTFAALARANTKRLPEFKNSKGKLAHSKKDGTDWTILEWAGAAAGEVGEACNLAKKLRRGDVTLESIELKEGCTVREALGRELADVVCYLDLVAKRAGIDLGEAVRKKFNRVSKKVGSKVKL